ncbi:GNAT family N-acetyltransferase [Priestia megaterium]|nr:GNAT family N-acetyltransferase [Priestia megaterium]
MFDNGYKIRSAMVKDFEDISVLKEQVQQLHLEGRPDLYTPASGSLDKHTYEMWLASEDMEVFVIEDKEQQLLAYMILDIKKSGDTNPILRDRTIVFIRSIGVSEVCRGKGIGKILMHKAFDYCREIQAESVELNVLEFNKSAIRFYESLGFKTKSRQLEWTGEEK